MLQSFFSFILSAVFLTFPLCVSAKKKAQMNPDVKWSMAQLQQKGFSKNFRDTLQKHYDKKSFERVLRLNHLGFLAPPNHMSLISEEAIKKSVQFIEKNKSVMRSTEKTYQVPEEIISSLLWIETRHGSLTGRFHVPSVYLHLMQANRKKNQLEMLRIAKENPNSKKYTDEELLKIIETRSEWRANWALEQLQALETIHKGQKKNITTLKGSFAGAFGIPQFIPSSYRDFSAAANSKTNPNLFKKSDAVYSVGRYLNIHGWDSKNKETHIQSLMKYNNSRDYAESIIDLSERVKARLEEKLTEKIALKPES